MVIASSKSKSAQLHPSTSSGMFAQYRLHQNLTGTRGYHFTRFQVIKLYQHSLNEQIPLGGGSIINRQSTTLFEVTPPRPVMVPEMSRFNWGILMLPR